MEEDIKAQQNQLMTALYFASLIYPQTDLYLIYGIWLVIWPMIMIMQSTR